MKCEPAIGEALRAQYASIAPGYHLNKRHWITITLNGDVPDERVRELVARQLRARGAEGSDRGEMNVALTFLLEPD